MATGKVIAAVIHDLLNRQKFADYAGLAEAIKERCAALKITYDSTRVTEALHLVERTRPILEAAPQHHMFHVKHHAGVEPVPLTRDEAADIWRRLLEAMTRGYRRRTGRR